MQLSKEVGITQKSAWFILDRLRELKSKNVDISKGTVEVDETFVEVVRKRTNIAGNVKESYLRKPL